MILPLENLETGLSVRTKLNQLITEFNTTGLGGVAPVDAGSADAYPLGSFVVSDQITEDGAIALNLPSLGGGVGTRSRWWNTETYGWGNRRVQIATEIFGLGTRKGRRFLRVNHDTWQPWREISDPERGANGNGSFVRLADGTQMCWGYLPASSAAPVTWTYPSAFSETPAVLVAPISATAAMANATTDTTTSCVFRAFSDAGVQLTVACRQFAVGRWY